MAYLLNHGPYFFFQVRVNPCCDLWPIYVQRCCHSENKCNHTFIFASGCMALRGRCRLGTVSCFLCNLKIPFSSGQKPIHILAPDNAPSENLKINPVGFSGHPGIRCPGCYALQSAAKDLYCGCKIKIGESFLRRLRCVMKLKDCDCGGIPQVTYDINGNNQFFVGCIACGNQTSPCNSLLEATTSWNQIYCCTLTPYENEAA